MSLKRFFSASVPAFSMAVLSTAVAFGQAPPTQQPYQDPNQPYQQQPQQYPAQPYQQQPQQYPAQPYQQQPQQYPAQQYQQQPQQDPQGYQQQPGQYQDPNQPQYQQPGQYQQPAQYQPQPGAYPPPAPPPPPAGHRGFLLMGNLGVNAFLGSTGDAYGTGLRLGGMFGFFLTPQFSLNLELMLDVLNLNSNSFEAQVGMHGLRGVLAVSPLYHVPTASNLEFVIGPKFGGWTTSLSDDNEDGYSYGGYLFGLNAGLYVRSGSVYWGGLLTFENSIVTQVCDRYAGEDVNCDAATGDPQKVVGITGSVLF
jgi:hypothetical protein